MSSVRRVPEHLGEHLPPVHLYADDLQEIVDIFNEVSGEVTLSTTNFEVDAVESLQQVGPQLHRLQVRLKEPFVSASLDGNNVWLYAAEDDAVSRGLFEKVKSLLLMRRRKLAGLLAKPSVSGSVVGSMVSVGLILLAAGVARQQLSVMIAAVLCLSVAGGGMKLAAHYLTKANLVTTSARAKSPPFFKRNRDQLVLGVSVAIVGAVVGALLTSLLSGK